MTYAKKHGVVGSMLRNWVVARAVFARVVRPFRVKAGYCSGYHYGEQRLSSPQQPRNC